jgi:tetratricopeptide (TPR) repeat protein
MEEKQSRDEPWAEVAFRLAELAEDRIDYQTAQVYYDRAIQLAPDNGFYLNEAGSLANTLSKYDTAIEFFEKALALVLKTHGPDHSDVATSWSNLGIAWKYKGQYDKAIVYYEKALASHLKSFGLEHPKVATCWSNLGGVWANKDDYDKAIDYYQKALASDIKTFGPEYPTVAIRWNNMGGAWAHKGVHNKAMSYYEMALPVFEKASLDHMVRFVKGNIASLKKQSGEQ